MSNDNIGHRHYGKLSLDLFLHFVLDLYFGVKAESAWASKGVYRV
jgi:hypothetical protein